MGLLLTNDAPAISHCQEATFLRVMGCKVCPLNIQPGRMEATGAERPLVYMLGEAPGKDEIKQNKQFVGESGQLLRPLIPKEFVAKLRWNNCVRSRPPKNRTPEYIELECCRVSVQSDIERSRPKAIFGFGGVPLSWVSGFSGITMWRGRRMPVKVGGHICWYYAFNHPAYLLRQRRNGYPSDEEHIFKLDLRRAFAEVTNLEASEVHDATTARAGVDIVTETTLQGLARIETFLGWAAKEAANGLDYETNCIRPYVTGSKILSAAVSMGNKTLAFPFDHPQARWSSEHRARLSDIWCRYLSLSQARKVAHNLSFEQEWTAVKFDPALLRKGRWDDTATQASILDERRGKTKPGPFSLEFLVQQYFGFNLKQLSNMDRSALERVDLPPLLTYNGLDAKYHLLLYRKQTERLRSEELTGPYELAVRRVPAAVLSQRKGVPVHQPTIRALQRKYEARFLEVSEEVAVLDIVKRFKLEKGHAFNPQSNPDIFHVFWTILKRPECQVVDKYSKKPKISCDEAVLMKIDHPLAVALLKLRKVVKRKSTYIDPLAAGAPESLIYPDGLSHPQFNTYFIETGRISCELPNWQQWPKREEDARELRLVVQAREGEVILAFDYGQIEGRVAAMFTKDKRYCDMLWGGYDIHQDWTERIAYAYPQRIGGKKYLKDKKALKTFRTDIKNQWTFPLIYGAKLESVAGYLGIPVPIIRPLFTTFWEEFEGIARWQDRNLAFYREYGWVECLTGRRRRGPLSLNKIHNTPIQGTAAEIVMDAMCRLSEMGDPEVQPELNIHDDLTFLRVPEDRVDEVAERVLNILLEVPFSFVNVPISVEMSVGKNWLEMEDAGTFFSHQWKKK